MIALLTFGALAVITNGYVLLIVARQLQAERRAHRRHRRNK